MNRWKTKVVEVLYGRMWFLAGMVVLMFCLSLFCSDARALYDIHNEGDSYVSGLSGINARWATGPDFGTVSAEATYNDAYGLVNDSGDVEIIGDFGPLGEIFATSGDEHAYGLFTDTGNIRTEALNGTIDVYAGAWRAVGLFAENGSIHTEDIGGTITVESWGSSAFGLRSDNALSSIVTGDITGSISVIAGGDRAYGFRSYGSIHTGVITGSITATATGENTQNGDYAYGLRSNGTMTTGAINGTISATADGSYAFGLDSGADMTIDSIGSDADISATAYNDEAIAIRSVDLLDIGDIDGTITATVTNGNRASAIRSFSDITIDDIGSYADISATAYNTGAMAIVASDTLTTGNIDGTITATATTGNNAYAMYAGSDITTGTIGNVYGDTQITATANGSNAYGLRAGNDLTVDGDIGYNYGYGGTTQINATATSGSNAYGMYAGSDLTVNGDIGYNYGYDGYEYGGHTQITATAGGSNAYALYAGNDLIVGDIGYYAYEYSDGYEGEYEYVYGGDTQITATAETDNAYGLYAGHDLTVGNIGYNYGYGYGNTQITATATDGSNAYGLYAGNDLTVDGDIGYYATISATAGDNDAAGLYSSGGSINIDGAINGTITATAHGLLVNSSAYGLYASNDITTGAINGTISAEMTNGSGAYGLYAGNDITVNGDIGYNAEITAFAGVDDAYGFRSGGTITTDAINGEISATAGEDNAYGLNSGGAIDIYDIYYGSISAEATTGSGAYGMYAGTGITIDYIDYSSDISATAGIDNAYGLSSGGTIDIGDMDYATITATATTGSGAYGMSAATGITVDYMYDSDITATAGTDNAVGVYSNAGSVNIGEMYYGTISAHAGGDYAYGILSYGPMDVTIDGGTVSAIADGGTNVAAIQSGRIGAGLETQNADDTVEIVAGSTIVGNIDLANNGTDNDLLTLSGYNGDSTTFADDINNVETINITGGTWHVNGSIINNTNGTTVNGGILEGTGTLGTLYINSGGTLNPGNSIGTINVAGDLTFASGSTYEVELNDSGEADKVIVTGAATLDGGSNVSVVALEHIRHSHANMLIIDADTLIGQFDPVVDGNTLFTTFGLTYVVPDGNVFLNVTKDSYAKYARTKNERSIGLAFDDLVTDGEDTGGMDDVISAIENLPTGAAANAAYDQIMPQDALGLPEVTRNMMNQFSESVLDHAGSVRASKQYAMMDGSRYLLASADNSQAAPPQTDKWLPYAKGLGTWGNRDGKQDIVGYNYNTYGIIGGVDKLVSEDTLLGFGIGGSRTNVDYKQAGTSADIESMLLSLYGSYFKDDWHVDLTLGYSHNSYNSQRGIHFGSIDYEAKSDHQGNAYNAAMEFGNNFGGTSMLLEPVVGVGYTSVQQGAYTEKGADSLNLRVGSETMEGIYSRLGLRLAKEFRSEKNPDMVWVPKANVFWIHDFADSVTLNNEFVGGGSFTTQTQAPVRDAFNIGAGLNVYFAKSVRLFVDYGWQTAGSFNANTLQAGAQWSF